MAKEIQTDVAIFGSGLSSAILARALYQKTLLKVDIFDAGLQANGMDFGVATPFGMMDYGPQWIPNRPEFVENLSFLEGLLNKKIYEGVESEPPRSFEKNEMTTFVGFGDKKPEAIEEWDFYFSPERLSLNLPIYAWCQELLHNVPSEFHNKSELTRLEVDSHGITFAVINGDTIVHANAYIFCGHPTEAIKLLPSNQVDGKLRQKLSKAKLWTSVSLNLVHKLTKMGEVADFEEALAIIGTGEVPFVAAGRFHTPRQETGKLVQLSQWTTLVAPEEGEEEEAFAHSLRELKKYLVKAFPNFVSTQIFEKIIVNPKSHGHCPIKFEKDESLQGFKNLWLSHALLSETGNIPGSISRAQKICEKLLERFDGARRDLPNPSIDPQLLNL